MDRNGVRRVHRGVAAASPTRYRDGTESYQGASCGACGSGHLQRLKGGHVGTRLIPTKDKRRARQPVGIDSDLGHQGTGVVPTCPLDPIGERLRAARPAASPVAASEIPSSWALTRPAWTHSRGGSLQRPQDVTEAAEPRIVLQVIHVEPAVDHHASTSTL